MEDSAGKEAYAVAISIQVIYTGMFVIAKAAFDHGLNTFVFVFYRQALASVLLLPVVLVRRRKNDYARSMLSSMLIFKLFICALIGNTVALNLYGVSLKFTSATVASATDNLTPALTFFISLLFRQEHVKLKRLSGVAKLAGVALSLAGVLVIALYAGPSISPVNHHRAFASHQASPSAAHGVAWVKWTFLLVLGNMAWSLWIVLQAAVLKECPDKLLLTVAQCVFGAVQSFVVATVAERDFSKWKLHFDVGLLAFFYSGIVGMGVAYYLQAWCVEMKGPVFFAAWTPLCFVFTIFCSSFFLGEIIHLGSIIGGILLVGGLYSVLWGKSKEANIDPCKEMNKISDPQDQDEQV